MNEKGVINSKVGANEVRVIIPRHEDNVSYILQVAKHIDFNTLNVGDSVLISFYSKTDGVVIAQL